MTASSEPRDRFELKRVADDLNRVEIFLFLTRDCSDQIRPGENLVSELQIPNPDALPVSFEFFGIEKGIYYLSGFANIEQEKSIDTVYGPGDLVHTENGKLACVKVVVDEGKTVGNIDFQLNDVASQKDLPAFF